MLEQILKLTVYNTSLYVIIVCFAILFGAVLVSTIKDYIFNRKLQKQIDTQSKPDVDKITNINNQQDIYDWKKNGL